MLKKLLLTFSKRLVRLHSFSVSSTEELFHRIADSEIKITLRYIIIQLRYIIYYYKLRYIIIQFDNVWFFHYINISEVMDNMNQSIDKLNNVSQKINIH